MKHIFVIALGFALSAGSAYAQDGGMKSMEMKNTDRQKCQEMMGTKDGMKGMDMMDMDKQKCQEMMGGKDAGANGKGTKAATTHEAEGTVKAIDQDKSEITLAHGPVKTLSWPAMTMTFSVKDKSMLEKVKVGQKVHAQFVKHDSKYVITSMR